MKHLKEISWNIIAVLIFITIELYVVFLYGSNAKAGDFIVIYIIQFLMFYLTVFWFFPKTMKDKFSKAFRIMIAIIWLITWTLIGLFIIISLYTIHDTKLETNKYLDQLIKHFFRELYFLSLALGYWYARKSIKLAEEAKEKAIAIAKHKEDLIRMELALLRSQMNPHLMINALSSIQGVLMEKAPETLKLIYTLVEVQTTSIKLSNPSNVNRVGEEILAVRQVIDLFSMLGKKPIDLYINVADKYKNRQFPGHVLVTIVENVFKHADFNHPNYPPLIQIKTVDEKLYVLIQNKSTKQDRDENRKKYGMEHVVRELSSSFNGHFTLSESTAGGFYELDITIQL